MIIYSTEPFPVGKIITGTIELNNKKLYHGPAQVMREATEEEFIQNTLELSGKAPRRVSNGKCYYYEISVD